MKLLAGVFLLCLLGRETTGSSIQEVIPSLSYIVELGCLDCPYRLRNGSSDVHDEWEYPPRPNSLLFDFTIDPKIPRLSLNDYHFYPPYYERRTPIYESQPLPFAPPFWASQTEVNESWELSGVLYSTSHDYHGRPLMTSTDAFELAYHYVDYKAISPDHILLEFQITGLRHKHHKQKQIRFGQHSGVDSVIRLLMDTANPEGERRIARIELVSNFEVNEPQQRASFQIENTSLAGPDWGGRREIDAGLWTDWSFEPWEWNDCGRKSDQWRQFLCMLEDRGMDYAGFIVACVLIGVITLISLVVLGWRIRKHLQHWTSRVKTIKEESDRLLMLEDDDMSEYISCGGEK